MPSYQEITVAGEGRPRRAPGTASGPRRFPATGGLSAGGAFAGGAFAGGLARTAAGALAGAARACRRYPGTVLGVAAALGAAGFVCLNALGHQSGPHPAPILPKATAREAPERIAAVEPARSVARAATPATPAAPRQAARDAIGDLIRAGETTASVTPRPEARRIDLARSDAAKPVTPKVDAHKADAPRSEADDAVLRAQRALAKLGYGTVRADGAMGPATRAAIERFEREAKLPVTGQAAGRTLRALVSRAGQG